MKKIISITTLLVAAIMFSSCKKDHVKISQKLLDERNESKCSELVEALLDELNSDEYYIWNGSKCVLTFEDELKDKMFEVVSFHKENQDFENKKHEFDEEKWNNWLYFYINAEEAENAQELFTNCFLCLEKEFYNNKADFDNDIDNFDYSDLVYSSYFGNGVKNKEDKLTEKKKAEIAGAKLVEDMFNPVKGWYSDLAKEIKIVKSNARKPNHVNAEINRCTRKQFRFCLYKFHDYFGKK